MPARFLQFHTLTSYPASLLNRDDAGMAKQIPFGGSPRTRISSQCLKRHWRTFRGEHDLATVAGADGLSVRSRETFREKVAKPLIAGGLPADAVDAVVGELMRLMLGESAKKEKARKEVDSDENDGSDDPEKAPKKPGKEQGDPLKTSQILVLGSKELTFVRELAKTLIPELKDLKNVSKFVEAKLGNKGLANLKATTNAGLDAAVFGRMVTSDAALARCDAAIHVAHAFTVHAAQSEPDYFSAVDDLLSETGAMGAGHINSTDLTTGLFYGYVAIDIGLLLSNLGGDVELAAKTTEALVHLIATVSPGAKLGSTAPHSFAHLVLAEAGSRQPCTLANSFLAPVALKGDVLKATYDRLAQEVSDLDVNFGSAPVRGVMARGATFTLPGATAQPLTSLAAWCAQQVR